MALLYCLTFKKSGGSMPNRKNSLDGYSYTPCRHYLHAWEHDKWLEYYGPKARGERSVRELHEELVCSRCGTIRVDRYNPRSFERIGRAYYYPEGYRMPGHKRYEYTQVHLQAGSKAAVKIKWEDDA